MMYKILLSGMILILSAACLPHQNLRSEKNRSDPLATVEEQPSLFAPSELEAFFAFDPPPFRTEDAPLPTDRSSNGINLSRLELPISDESNDDFNLEVLPEERPKKGPDFDIPIVMNEKVEHFIQYFQTAAKTRFSNWLARSEKYIPFMRNVLRENGLPEDLVYLALIESGFNPYAYSRSKASGPWQFIYLTGRRYGLKANWWIDERRDPEKSTIAAAKYLKDLYDMFECWYLAAAGYNAGEYKIATAMKRYRTEDFWELTKYRFLKQETKDYVPQMIAAALIAKDPEAYGFTEIEYQEPLRYEKVKVPALMDLQLIAKTAEIAVEELKDLNPELLRWCTPADDPEYEIKIPYGKRDVFLKNFETLQPIDKSLFRTHIVKKGETLPRIARLYRVEIDPLLEINRIKKTSRLFPGMNLLIPIPKSQDVKPTVKPKKTDGEAQDSKSQEMIYMIKKGDSLWSISSELGINIGALSRWNDLHPEKKLMPGDKLKIKFGSTHAFEEPSGGKRSKEIIYVVKQGDTLWSIAKKHNLTVSNIRAWNDLNRKDQIHPADRLKLRVGTVKPSTLN
ncbi:MAG TPA: LysM peptidoglycan-binding domain-containing protein [Thermodesulfobacteriota bacterium]|nr:LysM peptidoglycan-binding domain-containing protein [Thermodesulfobacteriota bacterium]